MAKKLKKRLVVDPKDVKKIIEESPEDGYMTRNAAIIRDSKKKSSKQFSLRIPKEMVELSKIDPDKDDFEFILVPYLVGEDEYAYTIKAELRKGEKWTKENSTKSRNK